MGDNFLAQFQLEHDHHIVDFMKIWYHYDTNKNGYLEHGELKKFVRDYVALDGSGDSMTDDQIEKEAQGLIALYDKNKDGKIELHELQSIVPKEKNFLTQFKEDITDVQFEDMFSHYDKDNNGIIEGPELIGLLRDMREHGAGEGDAPPTTTELESYRDQIVKMSDMDDDGKLQKHELKLLFLGS